MKFQDSNDLKWFSNECKRNPRTDGQTHGQSQTNIPLNFFEFVCIQMLDGRMPEDLCTTSSLSEP